MDIASVEKYIQSNVTKDFHFIDNRNKQIPFTHLDIPINRAKFALISSGGFHLKDQSPFDTKALLGDTTFRVIPKDSSIEDLNIAHSHYDHKYVLEDLNCGFPLELFRELENDKVIGELSENNYSFCGYILNTSELINNLSKDIATSLKKDNVSCVVLAPV